MTYQLVARSEIFSGAVEPATSVDSVVKLLCLMTAHICDRDSIPANAVRYGNPHQDKSLGTLFLKSEAGIIVLEEDVAKCRKGMEGRGYCVGLYVKVGET